MQGSIYHHCVVGFYILEMQWKLKIWLFVGVCNIIGQVSYLGKTYVSVVAVNCHRVTMVKQDKVTYCNKTKSYCVTQTSYTPPDDSHVAATDVREEEGSHYQCVLLCFLCPSHPPHHWIHCHHGNLPHCHFCTFTLSVLVDGCLLLITARSLGLC